MRVIVPILVAWICLAGCGKKQIIREAGAIANLSRESGDLARQIIEVSDQDEVVFMATQIRGNQDEIVERVHRVHMATADVNDSADDVTAWWGDFFMGSVENVKYIALAAMVCVIAFVGYRARIWSFVGGMIKRDGGAK
tara:strand:+ start:287 stop:703 length:417 start_codon:yes stop_codon:yes gene_type:complete